MSHILTIKVENVCNIFSHFSLYFYHFFHFILRLLFSVYAISTGKKEVNLEKKCRNSHIKCWNSHSSKFAKFAYLIDMCKHICSKLQIPGNTKYLYFFKRKTQTCLKNFEPNRIKSYQTNLFCKNIFGFGISFFFAKSSLTFSFCATEKFHY